MMSRWAKRREARRRAAVPTILQMEAVECGAASLAMILGYYGRWIPLEQLRVACGISRDGAKASNILRAARAFGMTAKGYSREAEDLGEIDGPAILHWNFNHFVVLEGISDDRAWLNDPATGARHVSLAELQEAFTGVVLIFAPGPDFVRGGAAPPIWRLLARQLRGSLAATSLILASSVALAAPVLVLPALSGIFVDSVLIDRQAGWFQPLMIAILAGTLLRAALTWFQQRILLKLEIKLAVTGITRFILHMLRLPIAFFTQRHPGEIANRAAAGDAMARLLSGDLATTALAVMTTILLALALLGYDWVLGSIAIVLALPNILVARRVGAWQRQLSRTMSSERGKLQAAIVGTIRTVETLKASGLEDSAFQRIAGHQANLQNIHNEQGIQGTILNTAPILLRGLADALVLGVGAYRVMDGALTLGGLVALQGLAASFAAPIGQLVALSGTAHQVANDLGRVEDALNNKIDPLTRWTGDEPDRPPLEGTLALEDLTFGYSPLDPPLIEGLSLTVAPGRRVALVGGSGSGKSTLGRIICGLLQPRSGQVLIGGQPLGRIHPSERAAILAYVDQDSFLFEGTVRENLTLWDPDIPDPVLTRALEDAAILQDIAARPGQIDARIDEGGGNFSGGQRQRLEIARALVGNPRILVLDEATAALDPSTEKRIDDRLRRRGCSCVIIAHRLSTIRDCDEIIVLSKGAVVERGTHEELLARDGEYAALLASQ